MRFRVISNALCLSVIFIVALFSTVLAEEYIIPIVVDNQTYTITVSVDGEKVTNAVSSSVGIKVGTPSKVAKQIEPDKDYAYNTIEYDELFRHSEKYVGARVEYVGRIVQVQEESCSDCTNPYYYMRIQVTKDYLGLWDDTIYLEIESAERFLEDDIVVFRGIYKGLYTYTAVLGQAVTVPAVIGESIKLGENLSKSPASGPSANNTANLRSGPGTDYPIVGSVQLGQTLNISAQNQDGSWLKLEDGKWIAAFLVDNTPNDLPVESTVNASSTLAVQQPTQQVSPVTDWRSASVQTCGDFEWRVTDVRRTKETWHYDEKTVARGQYLIVYIEIKNVGPGTSDLESSSAPSMNGRRYDFDPSWDAAWMMTGGHNVTWNDYNPGEVITVVAGFDVQPSDGYTFGMANCQQYVNVGTWDQVTDGVIRAS